MDNLYKTTIISWKQRKRIQTRQCSH